MKPAILFLCLSCALASGQPLPDQSPAWKSILARIGTNRPSTNYWIVTPFPKVTSTNFYWLMRSINQGQSWVMLRSNLFLQSTNGDWFVTNKIPSGEWFKLVRHGFVMRRFVDDVPVPILLATNLTLEVNGARVVK
jgi:hypothetical protein